jgi:hypothetical protein
MCSTATYSRFRVFSLTKKGLPERPLKRGSGANTFGSKIKFTLREHARPIAAVRKYMDEKKWEKAEGQVPQVSEAIERAAKGIDRAAVDLEEAVNQAR